MKRTILIILGALVAAVVFGGLVHFVLVVTQNSEPTGPTVGGMTPRRIWAIVVDVVAIAGVVIGVLALTRPGGRFGTDSGRLGAIVALLAGLVGVVNGGLLLAIADGGPGSGNGVIGAAGALVLGVIAMVLGGVAIARSRLRPERTT